ncbi:nicotinate-nucleotide--dimethylbenzimidazole phosphoribosyltransferase [Pseudomonas sp. TTU2014-080ASC]|uniref:nicotinate-nucleotide--dimethylbenzimidazole phosphoribosyltransferase n=1 Tax=Pseudomonas sp. TTU2014-080ASC TaxID=1729724 RepID=UPI000718423D|nr:nicotinate-nucleotide--dimethylbenzimidazole phosphoribosyltransferase [Pseudomonas sp. TTU2014-080ASC]KRW58059.1 nicotinate-nucleotide--dimethylbenzimidazole phosphoribosyltransferase [Pseudomonas sp. TTU2014-080ASC]
MNAWWQQACQAVNEDAREQAHMRQLQLTKPTGSLGRLEAIAIQTAALQGRDRPSLDKLHIGIFAGDHGIVAEGVSAYPQSVTVQMLSNFIGGGAAISVLAAQLQGSLEVIDLGTVQSPQVMPGVRQLHLGQGTANFLHQAAMTEVQLERALEAGRDCIARARQNGCELFVGGEMGIGNTTAATALACWLLKCPAKELSGPGTGLDSNGVEHKARVVDAALHTHSAAVSDALKALQYFGGFEVAALVGAYLACAQEGAVALVDGFICTVAALYAVQLNPDCRSWMQFAHQGAEPGHQRVLKALDAQPLLDLNLRLGEGSGAALAVPLLRLACALHNDMATFAEAAVADRAQ